MQDLQGYVYVLSNPAMPGIHKIGRSKNSGRVRARDIYKQGGTGVPMPFKMEFEIWSENCVEDEICVHEQLQEERINISREFFKIDLFAAIQEVCGVVLDRYGMVVGDEQTTLTEGDLLPSYGLEVKGISETLFPNVPLEIIVAQAVGHCLSPQSVGEAIVAYHNKHYKKNAFTDNAEKGEIA